jgi:hypothetical protein
MERSNLQFSTDEAYANSLSDQAIAAMLTGEVHVRDGCKVAPDGRCPHDCWSPLLILGYI